MNFNSRRKFIKQVAIATAVLPCAGLLLRAASTQAADTLPTGQTALSESDPVATAVGFHLVAKNIDLKKYPQFATGDGKKALCNNCALYTPVNGAWGKCSMLTAGLVPAKGLCGSWNKKS